MFNDLMKDLVDAEFPGITSAGSYGGIQLWRRPSLEELMDATPQMHFLTKMQEGRMLDHWEAGCSSDATGLSSGMTIREGATPTEAVARLWLALQTKPANQ